MTETDLSRLLPPGCNVEAERRIFRTALILSNAFFLLFFLVSYVDALGNAGYPEHAGDPLRWDMASCSELLALCPMGLRVTGIYALGMVLSHYLGYFSGSKSIYTMRRLGRPLELHIRCWAVPLLVIGVCLLSEGVLRILCGGFYLLLTPGDIDAANLWREIWS